MNNWIRTVSICCIHIFTVFGRDTPIIGR